MSIPVARVKHAPSPAVNRVRWVKTHPTQSVSLTALSLMCAFVVVASGGIFLNQRDACIAPQVSRVFRLERQADVVFGQIAPRCFGLRQMRQCCFAHLRGKAVFAFELV